MQNNEVITVRLYNMIFILSYFFSISFITSCTITKKTSLYFEDIPRDTVLRNLLDNNFELKIKKGDLLNIGVSSLSAENSLVFTAPQVAIGTSNTASGFMVDGNGNILYPRLGFIHVEGLTRNQLRDQLLKDLLPYLKEPIVTVNFVNHKITILGDIGHPQVLSMSSDNMTLLDAIGQSGELTKTSRVTNVLIIRDSAFTKQFKRLNLNNSSVFYSPYYYLQPNDVVYIETDPAKTKELKNTQQILSYVTTGISLIFLILSRIK